MINNLINNYSQYTSNDKAAKIDSLQEPETSQAYLTLSQFNEVEYDSDHLWFCNIDGAPSPFDKWFPAQSIVEPSKGLSVSTQSFGLEEVNMLNMYNAVTLRAELLDNDKAVLETWLRAWQADCATMNYQGLRYLNEILHTLYITKYDYQKVKVYTHAYYVLPTGDITTNRSNDPNMKVINVNFATFGRKQI